MSADWLNGIGLSFNMAGVVMIFKFGVPPYRPVADAGKSYLQLEKDDLEAEARTKHAWGLSGIGLGLFGLGFALQLVALLLY